MATPQEKAQCVSWFIETKLDVHSQRHGISSFFLGLAHEIGEYKKYIATSFFKIIKKKYL
jgi:hypothetical protein